MEKLPLLVHGKPITDHGGEDNVGAELRLQYIAGITPKPLASTCYTLSCPAASIVAVKESCGTI